ncbi:L-serine ammonia-lyase, iron-sulfur-dependent, subunit alpha [Saccharibacillus sp. CPCC 101409]|uniref:L-serine ammonia-lyase, iron-sulfur-dependent, subunit alpha n=1 Tax=Saccharibacillus sp. CPCC 101409 TaxID=3058041 RepID=UPI0026712E57|nr:L-serine ammonia-lyase, iron-sulfur-dependent, subunit alpha [Saccharibacillus sp. CPCC 101409]MDO3408614.1 L-serine ammonia-lyase, iron-sulfur-dependent, subunit alpha [Saccharibacillus sp. CPCC 101409]
MRFRTLKELAAISMNEGKPLAEVMIEDQAAETGVSREEIVAQMTDYYGKMKEAVRRGLSEQNVSRSGLSGGDAVKVMDLVENGTPSSGDPSSRAMAYALAVSEVNASMGRIIATPTAGSCGIIPGVFVSSQERFGWSDEHMVNGLFAAGAIGYVIANNSFISGAEGGCQAEVGSAIGMAAGAMVELRGGNAEQAMNAVGLALKNTLGLICDPVAGLVEIPCIVRNGLGAVNALAAADMGLAGVCSAIPSDEVVGVMLEVGAAMPSGHRETGLGGLAQTPTGRKLTENLMRGRKPLEPEEAELPAEPAGTTE